MQFPESEFWNFSLEFYRQPEIEKSCLLLQDTHQLNINLVLLAGWSALKHKRTNTAQWQQLIEAAEPWQKMIEPLRESRRLMKQSTLALSGDQLQKTRQEINDLELNTEHMQQLALEKLFDDFTLAADTSDTADLFKDNLLDYCQALSVNTDFDAISKAARPLTQQLSLFQEKIKIST